MTDRQPLVPTATSPEPQFLVERQIKAGGEWEFWSVLPTREQAEEISSPAALQMQGVMCHATRILPIHGDLCHCWGCATDFGADQKLPGRYLVRQDAGNNIDEDSVFYYCDDCHGAATMNFDISDYN